MSSFQDTNWFWGYELIFMTFLTPSFPCMVPKMSQKNWVREDTSNVRRIWVNFRGYNLILRIRVHFQDILASQSSMVAKNEPTKLVTRIWGYEFIFEDTSWFLRIWVIFSWLLFLRLLELRVSESIFISVYSSSGFSYRLGDEWEKCFWMNPKP